MEWTAEEAPDKVTALLRRAGAQGWEIDGDVDLEYIPGRRAKRAHTVFRFRLDRESPVYALLSAVAELPEVYSVGEL